MTLFVGGTGKIIRLSNTFDLSANTGLQITFTKPDGTTLIVTDPEVTAPGVPVTDPVLGPLLANQYMEYVTNTGDIDQAGDWTLCAEFQNTVPVPPQNFPSATVSFTVEAGC